MIITINDKARINVDLPNFTLEYKTVAKEGKHRGEEKWTTRGYYATPTGALFTAAHDEMCSRDQILAIHEFAKLFQAVCKEYRLRLAVLWDEKKFQELLARGADIEPVQPTKPEKAAKVVTPPIDPNGAKEVFAKADAQKKKRTPTRAR